MSDDFISEDKFYRTKKIVMALGLHFLLLAAVAFCMELAAIYLSLYEHANPFLIVFLSSFGLAALLYQAFDKISGWIWLVAGILNPFLLYFVIIVVFILFAEPWP